MTKLTTKHGVPVIEGHITVSPFAKEYNTRQGDNSYYDGTWEQLTQLVKNNWHNQEHGTGSINGDTLLITIPDPTNFYTPITKITPQNQHQIEEETKPRREGEKPVTSRFIKGTKPAATHVKIVIYRADVLAKDNDRSSEAEWEIIALLAQPQPNVPMHPHTMRRNNNHDKGGTYREYSAEEWAEAEQFWDTHAYIRE